MANFPTNPSIGDLFETKHDTFKWNGSAWEALGRILTHRQKSGTPYSSLSIKESGGVLDTDDTSTVLLVGEQTTEGQVKAAHSNDANTVFLSGETVESGISEFSSDGNTVFLSGETEESGISEFSSDANTLFLSGEAASSGLGEHSNDSDTLLLMQEHSATGLSEFSNDADTEFLLGEVNISGLGKHSSDGNTTLLIEKGSLTGVEAATTDVATGIILGGERDASLYKRTGTITNSMVLREGYRFEHEDWISTPSSSDFAFGTGDFTVEFWMWNEDVSNTTQKGLMQISDTAGGIKTSYDTGFVLSTGAGIGDGAIRISDGSQLIGSSSGVCKENVWQHIAVSRTSGVAKIFVDGKEVASGSFTRDIVGTNLAIGMYYGYNQGGYDYGMLGYMKDIRISKGIGRYTADFTTEITTKDSYHKLILEGGNDISDSGHALTFNNDVHLVSKTGNKAWHKYGSTDKGYLRTNENVSLDDDFTIEWWYLAKATGTQHMFTIGDSQQSNGLEFYEGGDGQKLYSNGGYIWTGGGNVSTNTWYHFAVVRNSGVVKVYRDGTQIGTDWSTNTTFTGPIGVGVEWYGGTGYCNGAEAYIDDFTVSKTAKYTGAFTPSTTAAPIDGLNTLYKATTDYDTSNKMQNFISLSGDATTAEKGYSFDGNGDYIATSQSSDFTFDGDFTVEFWAKKTADGVGSGSESGYDVVIGCNQNGGNNGGGWFIEWSNNRGFLFADSDGNNTAVMIWDYDPVGKGWEHVAFAREGTTCRLFVNGKLKNSVTYSANITCSNSLYVGGTVNIASTSHQAWPFNGNLADIRISKGIARYTADFATPVTTKDSYHKLILDGDTTDSSDSSHSLTFGGNALQTTKRGDRSFYFDGSGDYVNVLNNDLVLDGEFTIEMWVYNQESSSDALFFNSDKSQSYPSYPDFYFGAGNNSGNWRIRILGTDVSSGIGAVPVNEWFHVAVTRDSSNLVTLWQNGTAIHTISNKSGNVTLVGGQAVIGTWLSSQYHHTGYINDFRISSVARYSADFSLENSIGIKDVSSNNHTVTAVNDASLIKKAYYFDDSSHMSVADSSDFDFSGGDSFCIELWMNAKDFSSPQAGYTYMCTQSWANNGFEIGHYSDGRIIVFIGSGSWQLNGSNQGSATLQSSSTLSTDSWNHIALTYDGTDYALYINGVEEYTHTGAAPSYGAGNAELTFGSAREGNTNYTFNGYLTNIRITKGETVYSSNFTPAEILTEGANTKLLLLGDETDASSQSHALTFSGGATSTAKFINGLQFDGSGDYFSVPTSTDFDFGTDPFTIEFWFNTAATNSFDRFITFGSNSDERYWTVAYQPSGQKYEFVVYNGGSWQSTGRLLQADASDLTANNWHHLAVVRESGDTDPKLYINGSERSFTVHPSSQSMPSLSFSTYSNALMKIGAWSSGDDFNGYIDDLRISNTARYSSDFSISGGLAVRDKSSNSHSLSYGGNAAQSTSQVKFGSYSVSFDGNGDYLSIPDSDSFELTGDFTIETWVYFNAIQDSWFVNQAVSNNNAWAFGYLSSGNGLTFKHAPSGWASPTILVEAAWSPSTSQWYHVAVTRSGNDFKLFVDGSQVGSTVVSSNAFSNFAADLTLGVWGQGYSGSPLNGYLDDFRISSTARYTENFDVNTGIFFKDNSSNSHQITASGNAAASTTQKKFGSYSAYFDGTGDYADFADSNDWSFGTSDFTIEAWIYPTDSTNGGSMIVNNWDWSGAKRSWALQLVSTGKLRGYISDNGTSNTGSGNAYYLEGNAVTEDAWQHVAFVRNGTNLYLFQDGVLTDSTTISASFSLYDNNKARVGMGVSGDESYQGYIDDLRISNTARYTSGFHLNAGTYVSDQSSNSHNVTSFGTAAISTTQKKFGTHALYFDGTDSDYITIPQAAGTFAGDFTIECWVYMESGGSNYSDFLSKQGPSGQTGWTIGRGYTNNRKLFFNVAGSTWDPILSDELELNRWYHVAGVRESGTNKFFIDGTLIGTNTHSYTEVDVAVAIGNDAGTGGGNRAFKGYLDDIRISNTARYSSSFHIDAGAYVSDQSSNSHSVVAAGDAVASTAQKKFGTHSMYFDGSGNDSFNLSSSSDWAFGTDNDFTVEMWIRPTVPTGGKVVLDGRSGGGQGPQIDLYLSTVEGNPVWYVDSTEVIQSSTALAAETWHHLAVVRSSGVHKMYLDGVEVGSYSGSINYAASPLKIGGWNGGSDYAYDGYIDELRISNTARYSSNFHVDAGTYISDQSSNSLSITASGNAAVSTAEKKFGTHSIYFDGTGDYISVADHDDFTFGTSSFTIEFWMNRTDTNGNQGILFKGNRSSGNTGIAWLLGNDNFGWFYYGNGSIAYKDFTSVNCPSNVWQHVAMVYDGTDLKLYVNGTLSETHTVAIDIGDTSQSLEIGNSTNYSGGVFLNNNFYFKGYLDEFRISDTARYTSSFLLEDASTPIDKKGNHTLTLNGDALIASSGSSEETKFGTGAMKFDGNGDYISIPANANWNFGSDDFTVECWVKGGSTNQTIAGIWETTASDRSWVLAITSGSVAYFGLSTDGTNTNSLALSGTTDLSGSTWHHIAAVRSGNTVTLYVNGTAEASQEWNYSVHSTNQGLAIGVERLLSPRNYLNGCMDEFRISTTARYTGAFTPQLAEHDFIDVKGWGSPVLGSGERALFVNKNGLIMKSSDGTVTKLDTSSITAGQLTEGSAPASNSKPTLYVQAGIDSNTKLLLQMNGSNSGTEFTDISSGGHSVNANGGASTKTGQKKFGTASAYFDGNGDYLSLADHDDFELGSDDFTIECWIYPQNIGSKNRHFFSKAFLSAQGGSHVYNDRSFNGYILSNGKPGFQWYYGGSYAQVNGTTALSNNTWYHYAVVKTGGTVSLYINGNLEGSTSDSNTINATAAELHIGSAFWSTNPGGNWNSGYQGYIDEFRISNTARYTGNFTAPSSEQQSSGLYYRDPNGVETKIS